MSSLPFTPQEYEERVEKIRQRMSQRGLDALIVTGAYNMYYVSGYRPAVLASQLTPLMAVVIPAKGEPRLIARSLESEAAKLQWTKNRVLFMDHADPFKLLAEVLQENKIEGGKLGVEEGNLTVQRLNRMKRALPNAEFEDASGIVEGVSASPSKTEIDYMRKAAPITNAGFQRGIESVKEGVYAYEVVAEIHNAMYKAGQTDFALSSVDLWSGPAGGELHTTCITQKIEKGDLVTIEVAGVYNVYRVTCQGTIYVGDSPPASIADTYRMVTDMYQAARDAIKPGAKAGDVYDAANKVYRPIRGEDYFRRVGGSAGLRYFAVDLIKGNQAPLNPGVALLVQALVDKPALITNAGTVLVTETGYEDLTMWLPELRTV